MKKAPHPAMPSATERFLSNFKTLPVLGVRGSTFMVGRLIHSQMNATAAIGTRQKKAPRQPMIEPR
ncbi:hypothetical protein D3C72_1590490 [compost metagenome]